MKNKLDIDEILEEPFILENSIQQLVLMFHRAFVSLNILHKYINHQHCFVHYDHIHYYLFQSLISID